MDPTDISGRGWAIVDEEYWDALCAHDAVRALAAVKRLQTSGLSSAEIIHRAIVPAQRRIGELWMDAAWSVQDEHAATEINEGLVHWLGSFAVPPGEDRPLVLVSCVEGESHAMPALLVAETFVAAGYRVSFLGGDPDPDLLLRAILTQKPRAVLLSASLSSSLARPKPDLLHLRTLGIPVIVGGQGFGHCQVGDRRARALGATAYAETPEQAVEILESLPARVGRADLPPSTPADEEAGRVEDLRPRITAHVVASLRRSLAVDALQPLWWDQFAEQVDHLVGCLSAALATDDDAIMLEAHAWLVELMGRRGAAPGVVTEVWRSLAVTLDDLPLARALVAAAAAYVVPPAGAREPWAGQPPLRRIPS